MWWWYLHVGGGIHARSCLGIGEQMENSWMAWFKPTKVNCLKLWFQNIPCTFVSLGLGGGWSVHRLLDIQIRVVKLLITFLVSKCVLTPQNHISLDCKTPYCVLFVCLFVWCFFFFFVVSFFHIWAWGLIIGRRLLIVCIINTRKALYECSFDNSTIKHVYKCESTPPGLVSQHLPRGRWA